MIKKLHSKTFLFHAILWSASVLSIIIVIFVLWWDISRQPAISDTFSYSADSITSQTTYDVNTGQTEPTQYIKTSLELKFEQRNGQPTIRSTSGNAALGNQLSFTHSNQAIDAQKGVYLRNGVPTEDYVLAPRGQSKGHSFSYRHPSYSTPALMEYQGEETIGGLSVYRYIANYKNTSYIGPGSLTPIPAGHKLVYQPKLQLWVEPTSGWIIKYFNEVDIRLVTSSNPKGEIFSRTTETMTSESITQHVAYAKNQKLKFTFIRQIVPSIVLSLLFIIILTGFIISTKAKTIPVYGVVGIVLAVASAILIGWMLRIEPLIVLFAGPVGINPLTAVCFILTALAIVALYKHRHPAAAFTGGVITIFASLQLSGSLEVLPFSVDLLFFRETVLEVDQSIYSRMSPYTAFTFLLLGIGLIKAGLSSKKSKIHFARFLIGMVLAIGMLGIALKLTRIDNFLTIDFTDPFSIIPSLLFVLCAFTLLQLFRTLNDIPDAIVNTLHAVRWPVVATIPLVLIGIWTQIEKNSVIQQQHANFTQETTNFEKKLAERTDASASTLAGARALFSASIDVTDTEFQEYFATYSNGRQQELDAVGFARLLDNPKQQTILDTTRVPIEVFPQTIASLKAPIAYLESSDEEFDRFKGYDLLSDPILAGAMMFARDSGKTIISKRSSSLQASNTAQSQVFIIAPVYRNGSDASTTDSRRQALTGYVFGVINIKKLLEQTVQGHLKNIDVHVYDGADTKRESLIYAKEQTVQEFTPRITEKHVIFTTNRPWALVYTTQPSFGLNSGEARPSIILFGASFGYFTILAIGYFIIKIKRYEYARRK